MNTMANCKNAIDSLMRLEPQMSPIASYFNYYLMIISTLKTGEQWAKGLDLQYISKNQVHIWHSLKIHCVIFDQLPPLSL